MSTFDLWSTGNLALSASEELDGQPRKAIIVEEIAFACLAFGIVGVLRRVRDAGARKGERAAARLARLGQPTAAQQHIAQSSAYFGAWKEAAQHYSGALPERITAGLAAFEAYVKEHQDDGQEDAAADELADAPGAADG